MGSGSAGGRAQGTSRSQKLPPDTLWEAPSSPHACSLWGDPSAQSQLLRCNNLLVSAPDPPLAHSPLSPRASCFPGLRSEVPRFQELGQNPSPGGSSVRSHWVLVSNGPGLGAATWRLQVPSRPGPAVGAQKVNRCPSWGPGCVGATGHMAAKKRHLCLVALTVCSAMTYRSREPKAPTPDPLVLADHGGGRHSLLLPGQEEERRGPGAQHQRGGLQLQLLPQESRPIRR